MTGRQQIEAAFSPDGTREIPAVICYEGIFIRDHWEQLTRCPWWYANSPDLDHQLRWRQDTIEATGQDWMMLPAAASLDERCDVHIEETAGRVFRVNRRTGEREEIFAPVPGGWGVSCGVGSVKPQALADTPEALDDIIPAARPFDAREFDETGRNDLARRLLARYGREKYPVGYVASPLWLTYYLWGFEGMMTMVASRPDLVQYASERILASCLETVRQAAALGAAAVWIEECMTDMIGPPAFAALNVPLVAKLVEAIREAGMKSIYYYCGNPNDRWDELFAVGADALALEEGKKGFAIDIDEVCRRAGGACAVLGNLDAIDLLPNASDDELADAIARQVAAGRANGGRFVMSIGSPVTPATTVERVRRYCELARRIGS